MKDEIYVIAKFMSLRGRTCTSLAPPARAGVPEAISLQWEIASPLNPRARLAMTLENGCTFVNQKISRLTACERFFERIN
jgi:hypothetical protein